MKKIRTTVQPENGGQVYNAEIIVATEEDILAIQKIMELEIDVQVSASLRFYALEKLIETLRQKCQLLEELVRLLSNNSI